MKESIASRLSRAAFNLFPAYFGTGAHLTFIASDWREVRLEVPLSLRTRNYVGTIYGGSMYGAVDPIYMLMWLKNLGPGYVVWDKAATIRFRRPGRSTLHARFVLSQHEIEQVREELATRASLERVHTVELRDAKGELHAVVHKTLYFSRSKG